MHNLTKIKLFRILLYITLPISYVVLYPIILLKKRCEEEFFFFFDRFAMGGAQKIHIDILHAISNKSKKVYFTRKSLDDKFKEAFYSVPNTVSEDIHFWCDNLIFRLFTVHYYCFYLNKHKNIHVFSSNSTFFYDMLPFLKNSIIKTELLHNFTYGKRGMEFFGLANYKYLNYRITYDNLTKQNIINQYKASNIDFSYETKILFIEPGVNVFDKVKKEFSEPLKILYAGRGGIQKRVWLIDKIAKHFYDKNAPVHFHFAGTMESDLTETCKEKSVMHGAISDSSVMKRIYEQCHIVMLTSAYEGFPMVIKEGMMNGCVPLVTALEGNKTHLHHEKNALLITAVDDETEVVSIAINIIEDLLINKQKLTILSDAARDYAVKHFDKTNFENKYLNFFTQNG